jgi:chromosomal replication initiator protein
MNKEELWQAVLAQIQLNISPANFNTWFKNTSILSIENGKIVVSTPNAFAKEWLEQKYNKIILKILKELNQEAKEVEYIIGRSENKVVKNPSTNKIVLDQPIFPELKVDKETNLNPRYTFENFVIGSFNELAQAAAWAVANNPGRIYNPLFIYGGVGLGKTHLLQAIGNYIIKKTDRLKIKYIPTEKFTSEVISAIRNHSIENLKLKYREVDVLILDDVQFLAGKEKTQEEFFHTFNSLYEKNKQIVLSSDRPPKAIPALAERLRSRFEGGMIADIGYPDFETRLAILKQKSQERKINLSDEILSYLATKIQKNIRELEGALNRIVVSQQIGETINLENVKNILKSFLIPQNKLTTPKKIIQVVASFYDLKEKDLLSPSRRKEIVKPRQIITYLLRENLKCSFPYIGQKIGGKDHTTALHAYRKIMKEIKNNENLRDEIELINQIISGL